MSKKIKDLTLEEISNICNKHYLEIRHNQSGCENCPFGQTFMNACYLIHNKPKNWCEKLKYLVKQDIEVTENEN